MRQPEKRISVPVIIFTVGLFSLISALEENSQDEKSNNLLGSELDYDKRLYDFGLGKRAYSYYVSELKRFPVYNFGLGKRSQRYDFGLGKRYDSEDDDDNTDAYEDLEYSDEEDPKIPETELYVDDDMQSLDKRQKLYSFGLGKRLPKYEFGLGKRAERYDFGLGKRAQQQQRFNFGLGKRERQYNFGLGKRNRLYSFGLGKRPSERQMSSRFNFGLGKRSADSDLYFQKMGVDKREIAPNELEQINEENNSAETDFIHASPNKSEKQNDTVEIDSHEIMGHSDRSHSQISKRSAYKYDFGLGKRAPYRYTSGSGFSREFRKPLYNFGLGKRRPVYDFGLGKRSYQQ